MKEYKTLPLFIFLCSTILDLGDFSGAMLQDATHTRGSCLAESVAYYNKLQRVAIKYVVLVHKKNKKHKKRMVFSLLSYGQNQLQNFHVTISVF